MLRAEQTKCVWYASRTSKEKPLL